MQKQPAGNDNMVIEALASYGYEVIANELGYLIHTQADLADVPQARNPDDLIDLAELIAWRYSQTPTRPLSPSIKKHKSDQAAGII